MKDKYIGISKVGEKGQIVIPKNVREMFNIQSGDTIVLLADKQKGIAILKGEVMEETFDNIMKEGQENGCYKNK